MRDDLTQHLPAMRRYARMLTGNAWAADDLVQDTLERACRKWLLWKSGSNLRAWLFTLMHNLHVNQLRSSGALSAQPILVSLDDVVADATACPADPADDRLDLQNCLLQLPTEQREVLLLISVEGLEYAETAQVLGVPIGTVMSRLHRARARMRELMTAGAIHSDLDDAVDVAADGVPPSPPMLRRLK